MALVWSTLALILIATTALEVDACVCYLGQEPDATTGKRYGWSLAEKKPCECTEFRLGGVNMKPQIKPYEVTIGDGPRISINKHGEIRPSLDCNDVSTASGGPPSPCQNYTIGPSKTHLNLPKPLTLPIRLEFIVRGTGWVFVLFCADELTYANGIFSVALSTSSLTMWERAADKSWDGTGVKPNGPINIFGKPFIVTYNNGHIEAGLKGVEESFVTYDLKAPPQASSWFIMLENEDTHTVQWSFYEPCIPLSKK